jgi:glucosamine--fructose-6-phosphate aminotransferase (isomerizing)
MNPRFHTYAEILSQPETWAEALEATERNRARLEKLLESRCEQVLFIGCGSTYYLSLSAAALFQQATGRIARAVPSSELWLNRAAVLTDGPTLLVAVSRSGSTTETVYAVEQFKKQQHGPVVGITVYGDSPLANLADLALVVEKGQERSVVQTRSFTGMYVAATALSLIAGGREDILQSMRRLPEIGARLMREYEALAQELGEDLRFDRFYFLGSGARYGLACEASLKLKEMSLSHSEPFHFLEFRHGPMSMVNPQTMLVVLLSERHRGYEQAVLEEMQERGASVLSLGEDGARVAFTSGIPEEGYGVLYLPVLQLMAYHRAVAKGLNPDHPHNLTAVVTLDLSRVSIERDLEG